MQKPSIGRIVIYRSRTGNYSVPAIVTATIDTLAEVGLRLHEESGGEKGVPPLSSDLHVHLAVLTPGKPGLRADAQDFVVESPHGRSENVGGAYQEWDVPYDGGRLSKDELEPGTWYYAGQPPGTWSWPVRVP